MSESSGSATGSFSSIDSIDSLDGTPSRTLEQELSQEYVVHTIKGGGRRTKGFRRRTLGLPPEKDDSSTHVQKMWYRSPTEVGAKKAKKPGFGKVDVQDDYDFHQKFLIREEVFGDPSEVHGGTHGHGPEKVAGWELWWVQSPLWRRMLLLLCVVYFFIAILQFCFAIFLFATHHREKVEEPRLCTTDRCRSISTWLGGSMDESVSPCEDFYNFTCGNHRLEDVGPLYPTWRHNFLHVEADGRNGRSIVAKLLMKKYTPNINGMGEKMVKYYKTCMRRWAHPSNTDMRDMLSYAVHYLFKDIDVQLSTRKDPYELEEAFARMITVLGDSPFSKLLAPTSQADLIIAINEWTSHIEERNIKHFLPFVFNALKIHNGRDRYIISQHVYYLGHKFDAILHHGHDSPCYNATLSPEDQELCKDDPDLDFNFNRPYYLAFFKREQGLKYYDEDEKKINGERKRINKKTDHLQGTKLTNRLSHFDKDWNYYVKKRFKKVVENSYYYKKASYLTLFSFRLLIEVSHEAMDTTAMGHRMHLPSNAFFSIFQSRYFKREKEARCFDSLLESMGYLPVYRFLRSSNDDTDRFTHEEVMGVITHAKEAVKEAFSPPEVGGLRHVSSRYRERILRTLSSDTNILIPMDEDDEEYVNKATPPITKNHIENVLTWREFTNARFIRSWVKFDPKSRIIWHTSFYRVDQVNVYEAPSVSDTHLIKFPTGMFFSPFWRNNLPIANYAGARVLAAKGWLKLVVAEFQDTNIDYEIEAKKNAREGTFYEGIITDGDFHRCHAVTYNWFYPEEGDGPPKGFANTPLDPHFMSLRCGSKTYEDGVLLRDVKFGNSFMGSLALRIMFKKGFEELKEFRETFAFWHYSAKTRALLSKQKLPGYEDYTEEQLLFILHMRALCRSTDNSNKKFLTHHTLESNVGLMQYSKFAEVWNCPKGYPMNPLDQCF